MSLSLDRSLLKPVATVVAIVLSLFQIYFTGGFGVTDAHILRGTHLTLIMILVLLLVPSRKLAPGEKEGWFPILIDLALIALAIAINVYVFQEADNISRRLKYVEDVTNLVKSKFERLQSAYDREVSKNGSLSARIYEVCAERDGLKGQVRDYERVRRAIGPEQADRILEAAYQQEQVEKEQKWGARSKIRVGAR